MTKNNKDNLEWYELLGFYKNPFSIKPAAFHDSVLGYGSKLTKLNLSIRIGGAWFISGSFGSGKTSVLRHIIHRIKKTKKVIYYSMNRRDRTLSIRKLLLGRGNFFMMLFRILPKNTILLIDESQHINRKECDELLCYYEQGNIKSLIFSGRTFEDVPFTPKLKQLIGENLLDLNIVSKDVAIDIVRGRIGNLKFLPDNMIRKLFEMSESNPRKLLENCEDVCKLAVEKGAKKVTLQHLKAIE